MPFVERSMGCCYLMADNKRNPIKWKWLLAYNGTVGEGEYRKCAQAIVMMSYF